MEYRQARPADLDGVAQVFAEAFPTSIAHYFRRPPSPAVLAEPFALCLASEPEAFFVADEGGRIAGYLFAPSKTGRLAWLAVARGHIFRWFWRWISGQYRIGLGSVRSLALNKLHFLVSNRKSTVTAEARILSVAVHPAYQGRGIARELCRQGLSRLDRLGIRPVRLEVRPENTSALRLYTDLGFRAAGVTWDSQGEWLVMLRD